MATLSSLVPRVRTHALAAPSPTVEQKLIDTVRDFCRRTLAWRKGLDVMDTNVGEPLYTLAPPTDAEIADVIFGDHAGTPLVPKTAQQLRQLDSQWRTRKGSPKYIRRESRSVVRLVPAPQTSGTEDLYFTVALMPTLTATSIDDDLIAEHLPALVDGALSMVLDIKGQPWTDKVAARDHYLKYEAAVRDAESKAAAEHTKGIVRRVKYGGL